MLTKKKKTQVRTKILSLKKGKEIGMQIEKSVKTSITIGIIINPKHLSKKYNQRSVMPLQEDARK